jgi:hypothetical protein
VVLSEFCHCGKLLGSSFGDLALAGVAISMRVRLLPVNTADPLTLPNVALMVAVPASTPVASPVPLIVARVVSEEVHATDEVTSWFVPSESAPVATNFCVVPLAMPAAAGETRIDMTPAGVTVRIEVPNMLPRVAVIVTEPEPSASASPAPLIVARVGSDELHVTDEVTSTVLLFTYKAVAVNC